MATDAVADDGAPMDLVLIGGVSGSGKSVALAALEDSGYYTVNNLPLPMLLETLRLSREPAHRDASRSRSTSRSAPGSPGLAEAITSLKAKGWTVRFVYLEAKVETLVKRFSETRRRHPFSSDDRTLTEAIDYERGLARRRADARHRHSTRASCRPRRCAAGSRTS